MHPIHFILKENGVKWSSLALLISYIIRHDTAGLQMGIQASKHIFEILIRTIYFLYLFFLCTCSFRTCGRLEQLSVLVISLMQMINAPLWLLLYLMLTRELKFNSSRLIIFVYQRQDVQRRKLLCCGILGCKISATRK